MGKKKRLNRFIRKWIKSDLPDDRSPEVLLLGVTRIPTSPSPARRPCSLPLCPTPSSFLHPTLNNNNHQQQPQDVAQARRICFVNRRNLIRRNSSKKRPAERPLTSSSSEPDESKPRDETCTPCAFEANTHPEEVSGWQQETVVESVTCSPEGTGSASDSCSGGSLTPSRRIPNETLSPQEPVMDRSVDSIGACSLDVEASADLSDWTETSSAGTLRSASILTPSPEPHLPSYLSLACTVNGYCTTTNYDPVRLAKSRDASPHRPNENDHLTPRSYQTYSVQNNLLSPPNLVPLPTQLFRSPIGSKMSAEDTLTQHHNSEFYSSSKTMTIMKESHFSSSLFSQDTVDKCIENGHHSLKTKIVSYDNKSTSITNGQTKCNSESTTVKQEWKQESETKSFIKQRIERLYGPGALAQVVFRLNRQRSRNSESENDKNERSVNQTTSDRPSNDASESIMKQSTSSPTLPVMRHLRPEFRAQLPVISPRKATDNMTMQKSSTVPTLKEEVKLNGHSKIQEPTTAVPIPEIKPTDIKAVTSGEKNGHYFLKILDEEAERLLELADQAESELATEGLSEEVIGKLRSASGKARLLVSQKMQQFKGLCTNNITQAVGEAFPTTNEDLQGFWDMVMLQVDQVNALFKEIKDLKANNWIEIEPVDVVDSKTVNGSGNKPKKALPRPRQVTALNEEARKQREAQRRKIIEDRRKAMKAQNKPKESIEIFVPENS